MSTVDKVNKIFGITLHTGEYFPDGPYNGRIPFRFQMMEYLGFTSLEEFERLLKYPDIYVCLMDFSSFLFSELNEANIKSPSTQWNLYFIECMIRQDKGHKFGSDSTNVSDLKDFETVCHYVATLAQLLAESHGSPWRKKLFDKYHSKLLNMSWSILKMIAYEAYPYAATRYNKHRHAQRKVRNPAPQPVDFDVTDYFGTMVLTPTQEIAELETMFRRERTAILSNRAVDFNVRYLKEKGTMEGVIYPE